MTGHQIPFNRPFRASRETSNLEQVLASGHGHGDGPFTAAATARLKDITRAHGVLLTTSCTHALEMAALLLELGPGDEVIVPSFAFPSMANAVALRGATCVFVDIDLTSGNIDTRSVEAAVTSRTKAVVVLHYGGVAADLDRLLALARDAHFAIIEDNAHGLGGTFRGRALGTIGNFGTLSFHSTKNIQCGEGGALLITDDIRMPAAEIIRDKGTDRALFQRGQVDKYSWKGLGSSYLPSELNAAVLDAQLAEFDRSQDERHRVWNTYAVELDDWARRNDVRLMEVGEHRRHSAHLFFLRSPTERRRDDLINHLADQGISARFHYVPLDSSRAGVRLGRTPTPCLRSSEFSNTIVRLPLWSDLTAKQTDQVVDAVMSFVV